MNNKAFRNFFCNRLRSFHTSPGSSDSNDLDAKFSVNAIIEFEEWLTASIIRVERFQKGVKTLLRITE